MNLNNIELPEIILAELYKDTLLYAPATHASAAPANPATPATPPSAGYKFLGNNRRKITILVAAPGTAFLPDDQLSFLTKILEACQMNIGDVAIVNQASAPVLIADLRQQLQPSFILLFGVETIAIRLPIQFPDFKIQEYDQCTYLSAPPLEQLVPATHEGRLLKSKLWLSLKSLFNV
jgi:hypothetical protein